MSTETLPKMVSSNRLEELYESLMHSLYDSAQDPFIQKIVIIPNHQMKRWLTLRAANDERFKVMTGIKFCFLNEAVMTLAKDLFGITIKGFPTSLELALRIEWEIRQTLKDFSFLSVEDKECWLPLFEYIGSDLSSIKSNKRLTGLSHQLAKLFCDYGLYGGRVLAEFEQKEAKDWQEVLWCRLFHEELGAWAYPYKELARLFEGISQKNWQVHLFSFSFLSQLHVDFFYQVAQHLSFTVYLLSPTRAFWTDLLSEWESKRLSTFFENKGAKENEREELEAYLRDTNPLLANFGRLGREFARQLEEKEWLIQEYYSIAKPLMTDCHYENLADDEISVFKCDTPSLLQRIQTDLLLLRNPSETEPQNIEDFQSIQIHVAPSKMREVEILYQQLLSILDNDRSLEPKDILVMAPRIEDYAPYIRAVFESCEGKLPIQLTDLRFSSQCQLAKALELLLQLPESRWNVAVLMDLFQKKPLQRKHDLTDEDIDQLKYWIEQTGIRWGTNAKHRLELLKKEYGKDHDTHIGEMATWEHGIHSLILNLAGLNYNPNSLSAGVNLCKAELLGKWLFLLNSLKEDLTWLTDGTELTLMQWADYLECLLQAYFSIDFDNEKEVLEKRQIYDLFESLRKASQSLSQTFPFSTLKYYLIDELRQERLSYKENCLQSIRFSSLLPMRAIPAKVICLLGLEEGSFPRRDVSASFDLCRGHKGSDYCPTRTDYDRYLFIESMLSCRSIFYISYCGRSPVDHKEQPPSTALSELINYLDRHYKLKGANFSDKGIVKHPFYPFHKSYFEDQGLRNFSKTNYLLSQIFYNEIKVEKSAFISEITVKDNPINPQLPTNDNNIEYDLRHLLRTAKNPLKTYLEETLKVRVENLEEKDLEKWSIDALEMYRYKQDALSQSLAYMLSLAEKKGRLPIGGFKQVAIENLEKEVIGIQDNMVHLNLSKNSFVSLRLTQNSGEILLQKNSFWTAPLIKISHNNTTFKIVGKIEGLTNEGLVILSRRKKELFFRHWPTLLVLNYLYKFYDSPFKPALVFMASGEIIDFTIDDPETALKNFIEFHLLAIENPCPLIPEWLDVIISGDVAKLQQMIENDLTGAWSHFFNDEAKFALKGSLPDAELITKKWQQIAEKTYQPLLAHYEKL
ncbi:MAG: exodeoxyribonuclease V subunit gamma [Parachlamydiales bacterium]|nr:exodeoxyribonuclease V subunit gamma [Parachlamydiales bacterium]